MHLEATVTREDLVKLFAELLPLTVRFGGGDHYVSFRDPEDVELLPGEGLRLASKAKVVWPVLGIAVPIAVHRVTVRLRPEVTSEAKAARPSEPYAGRLLFRLAIEHADFAMVPDSVDISLTERINAELEKHPIDLSWGFARMLSCAVKLPAALVPLDALGLEVTSGEIAVSKDALRMTVALRSEVIRTDSPQA